MAKLLAATVVQHEVWTGGIRNHDKELENDMDSTDFCLISKLGVARTIPTALRYMPRQFCGMELNSLPVETTVAQINYLLQHYGTETSLGTTGPLKC